LDLIMSKIYLIIAAAFGFLAVATGAFGAHALKDIIPADKMETFRTGVLYHLVHSVALLAIALSGNKNFIPGFVFIAVGIILFSFSLYIYSITGIKILAMITPIGGLSFLVGWGMLAFIAYKHN